MNIYYIIIILNAIYSSILITFNSVYLKKIDIMNLLFIQYTTCLISTVFIYLCLSKEQFYLLFTSEYTNLWIFNVITSITGVISWYYYYYSMNNTGPAKTQLIFSISKITALFIISIYILSNSELNFNIIIGIILSLLGIYILESNSNYM